MTQKILILIPLEMMMLILTSMVFMTALRECEKEEKGWKVILLMCGISGILTMFVGGIGIMTS